jgi:hypothetical protein
VKFDDDGAKFSTKMRMRRINCKYLSFIGILFNRNCNTQTDHYDGILKNHISLIISLFPFVVFLMYNMSNDEHNIRIELNPSYSLFLNKSTDHHTNHITIK